MSGDGDELGVSFSIMTPLCNVHGKGYMYLILHYLAGATIKIAKLGIYNCHPLEDGNHEHSSEKYQSVGRDFKPWPRLLRRFETRTTAGEPSGDPGQKHTQKKNINPPRQYWLQPRNMAKNNNML